MALRIRFARHDARPDDLFTPSIREDAPATFVLVVN
jgi:hypothetical protein